METRNLILAGIAAARRWNVRESVQVIQAPPGMRVYSLHSPYVDVPLEHWRHIDGDALWMGYSAAHNALVISLAPPLDTDGEKAYNGSVE